MFLHLVTLSDFVPEPSTKSAAGLYTLLPLSMMSAPMGNGLSEAVHQASIDDSTLRDSVLDEDLTDIEVRLL